MTTRDELLKRIGELEVRFVENLNQYPEQSVEIYEHLEILKLARWSIEAEDVLRRIGAAAPDNELPDIESDDEEFEVPNKIVWAVLTVWTFSVLVQLADVFYKLGLIKL